MAKSKNRSRDLITGTWTSRLKKRRGLDVLTACVDFDSRRYDDVCETSRVNDILGDIEGMKKTGRGNWVMDVYDGKKLLSEMTMIKGYKEWTEGRTFLDGTLRMDLKSNVLTMLDDDFAKGMVIKHDYY